MTEIKSKTPSSQQNKIDSKVTTKRQKRSNHFSIDPVFFFKNISSYCTQTANLNRRYLSTIYMYCHTICYIEFLFLVNMSTIEILKYSNVKGGWHLLFSNYNENPIQTTFFFKLLNLVVYTIHVLANNYLVVLDSDGSLNPKTRNPGE